MMRNKTLIVRYKVTFFLLDINQLLQIFYAFSFAWMFSNAYFQVLKKINDFFLSEDKI